MASERRGPSSRVLCNAQACRGESSCRQSSGDDGERFETAGAEAANYDTVLVRTEIVQRGGTTTRLDYRLRGTPEGPRVIDVFLNGTVSELAMRRAEYSSVIQREGFDALLTALHQRVAALPVSSR